MDKLTENTKTSSPSSLQLAFLGDAVYELYVREHVLAEISGHVDKLNKASKKLSMAVTQAKIADLLVKEERLSEGRSLAGYRLGVAKSQTQQSN